MTLHQLKRYGVSERFLAEATLYPEETLARVIAQYRGKYKVVTQQGELLAEVSGDVYKRQLLRRAGGFLEPV